MNEEEMDENEVKEEKRKNAEKNDLKSAEKIKEAKQELIEREMEFKEAKKSQQEKVQKKAKRKVVKARAKLKAELKKKKSKFQKIDKKAHSKTLQIKSKKQPFLEDLMKGNITNWTAKIGKSVSDLLQNVSGELKSEIGMSLEELSDDKNLKKLMQQKQIHEKIPHNIETKRLITDNKIPLPFSSYKGDDPYIFVSYAHKDKELVYHEIEKLHKDGFKIWYDEGIPLSTEWNTEVAKALKKSSCILVFITNQSVKSKNVQNEINFALKYDRNIVPVYLEDTILPEGLELQLITIQAIHKYKMEEIQFFEKIRSNLKKILN
ncbi:MAG: toll/interleukin-1 receptor domain-containing protein [Promethearchaeota archaeon]